MKKHLETGQPFSWEKIGLVYEPNMPGYTHGSHPCILPIGHDDFIVAFTCRDMTRRSHIFLTHAKIIDERIELLGEPRLALNPGVPGSFDCDGVISVCFVSHAGKHYLYYVGWQNLPEEMWMCDTGMAVLDIDTLTLEKKFTGPVIGRNKDNPLFAAATAFHINGDTWHTWYNSGIEWEKRESGWHHRYGLHHATSKNGVDWVYEPGLCMPFADEYEYAFGRPSVYYSDSMYFMWFAHRATKTIDTYRIGFASSSDGLKWERNDALAGIDVSPTGWDSQMICYPYVFEHRGRLYMLYNGNHYGQTGFGLAILQEG